MNDTPETRHLCTECWTEGEGSAPKACPVCGTVGAWFVTATHGNRPLKEVLVGLFSGYQVPPELEGVLTKPSEYAQAEDEKQAAELRQAADALLGDKSVVDIDLEDISAQLEDEGRDVPAADIEILAECPVLWSGWECDHTVLLYRIRSTGETGLRVVAGVSFPGDQGPVAMLEERLGAYREAIAQTQEFIARVRKEMPDETA